MDKILLGVKWNPRTGRTGRRVYYKLRSHFGMYRPVFGRQGRVPGAAKSSARPAAVALSYR